MNIVRPTAPKRPNVDLPRFDIQQYKDIHKSAPKMGAGYTIYTTTPRHAAPFYVQNGAFARVALLPWRFLSLRLGSFLTPDFKSWMLPVSKKVWFVMVSL